MPKRTEPTDPPPQPFELIAPRAQNLWVPMLVLVLAHVDWVYELDVVHPFFAHTPDWQDGYWKAMKFAMKASK